MSPSSAHIAPVAAENLSYSLVQEHILIGKNLGNRYRILREIGSGGMAWVYLAEDPTESNLVAVKVLYPQFGEDLSYIQRFNREAKLASALTDPHIVRVLDYGADRDVYYLVMEYIEGQNLRDTLEIKGTFPWKNALEIIDQLATALEHAHRHGVVHRDIKPQNMMLTESGLLKVLDFGIARIPTLPSLTQSGFIGSPYYVSPEQAMGEEVDTRSDIYSAGIVLYELLSGRIPFDAKSPWSIINQHITADPPTIDLADGEIPAEVQKLLNRMVAKRPEERFPNPVALRRAIAAVLADQPIPASILDTQPITPPDKKAMAENLYQRALKAIDAEEWDRVVDLLNQVLNLAPNHTEASKELSLAEQKTFLASLYNAGQRAMKHDRWEEAINSFTGVIELEPNYRDVEALLAEAQKALEEENARQLVITRYNEGLAHFEAGRWHHSIEAFREVQRLSPDYKRTAQLLAEAEQYANPGLFGKFAQAIGSQDGLWRWGLVAVGIIVVFVAFFTFGNGNPPVVGDDDLKLRLKALYEEAQQAIDEGDKEQAVALLDEILQEDPDYADVATLKRELVFNPTPIPTPTSTPEGNPLAATLESAQDAAAMGEWSKAIDALNELRAIDPDYEQALITSLFCDASVGRGLEIVANIGPEDDEEAIMNTALADFEAGAKECPRRMDLQDQVQRANAYLKALTTPANKHDTLIQLLNPVVAADPDYAGRHAKKRLYDAYLNRGKARREASDIVGALGDFEAALALNVDDPGEAQTNRAELLLAFGQQQAVTVQPTAEPVAVATSSSNDGQTDPANTEPTPTPVRIKFKAPPLVSPEDDAVYAGQFVEVFLEWEPVGSLARDEYYDLTIMHIFADEPAYWGTATRENQVRIEGPAIGVGKAGGDRFYWWVTVRKANTAPSVNSLDLPVSQRSEARTFVWSP